MCMKVPILLITIILLFFLTLFSRKLRQEEDIIEYVKDYCLQEDGTDLMEINTAEYIFFNTVGLIIVASHSIERLTISFISLCSE